MKKAKEQIHYYSQKHWGTNQFQLLKERKEKEIELEFIKEHKRKPKTEDFFDIGAETEEEDFLALFDNNSGELDKDGSPKGKRKETVAARQERYIRRL
jgi:hypothetical protein